MNTAQDHLEVWGLDPLIPSESGNTYSTDDVINAYLKGKEHQRQESKSQQLDHIQEILLEKLKVNLNKAALLSEELFREINNSGFKCDSVRLKIKDVSNYMAIFLVDEKDFCSDDFLKIYDRSIEIKRENNASSTFNFSTLFTPKTIDTEPLNMVADGYILSYNGPE